VESSQSKSDENYADTDNAVEAAIAELQAGSEDTAELQAPVAANVFVEVPLPPQEVAFQFKPSVGTWLIFSVPPETSEIAPKAGEHKEEVSTTEMAAAKTEEEVSTAEMAAAKTEEFSTAEMAAAKAEDCCLQEEISSSEMVDKLKDGGDCCLLEDCRLLEEIDTSEVAEEVAPKIMEDKKSAKDLLCELDSVISRGEEISVDSKEAERIDVPETLEAELQLDNERQVEDAPAAVAADDASVDFPAHAECFEPEVAKPAITTEEKDSLQVVEDVDAAQKAESPKKAEL